MKPISPEFGEAVTHVIKREHNLTQEQASVRTGIDRYTISQMMKGKVPPMEQVLKFARGFGKRENEWLVLAGEQPIEPTAEEALQRLVDIAESQPELLHVDPDLEDPSPVQGYKGAKDLSENDLRTISRIRAAAHTLKRHQRGEE